MADADGTIDRYAFFDALRAFFPTRGAHETRIYPDRIEVHRFARGEDGNVLHDSRGLLFHTVETYLLTGGRAVEGTRDARPCVEKA